LFDRVAFCYKGIECARLLPPHSALAGWNPASKVRMHVVDMVFFWARTEPHRPAIIQPEMVTTFQGLADAIESIGERIDRLGLDQREPIAVSIANPSFFMAAAFAVLRCGHSVALVTSALYPQLQAAGIRNLIYDTQGLVLSGGRNIRFDMSWLPKTAPSAQRKPYRRRPIGNVNAIRFTSGTTGLAKMHVQSRAALEQRLGCPATTWLFGAHKSALIMPGIASGFGFNSTCGALFAGKAAGFAPSSEDALWLIRTFGIDTLIASPKQALLLAEIQEEKTRLPMLSLKTLIISGASAPPDMIRKLRSNLCRRIVLSYASTEAGTAAGALYDVIENIPDAVGFVTPDVEIEIVDEAGAALATGADGLIRLRTPYLLLSPEMDALTHSSDSRDPWFYPGDMGHLTQDGVLCVTGRSAEVINSGGVKVSAIKIEEIVQALPEIKEAAACGVMGPAGIEKVWIAVLALAPINVQEIKRRLKEHNEVGFAPAEVFVLDQFPRGDLGKVQKYVLKEQLLKLKRNT
jgi:long-chain acyl-CoA synthetase